MSYNLMGKIALVTGAAGKMGIGRAIARHLAQDGANVVIVDLKAQTPSENDKTEGWRGLNSVIQDIEDLGRECLAIEADITKSEQVKDMVDKTLAKFGRIDILVNNAAILGPRASILEYDEKTWEILIAVNLTGTFLCSKAVAKAMVAAGRGGKIVNIASMAGKIATPGFAAYSASKAGMINLTQALALELAPYKINVNAVCPGATLTEIGTGRPVRSTARKLGISIEEATAKAYAELIPTIPLGRIAQPEEQANAVAFLASNESDFITGIALNVTGGMVMAP